MVSRVARTSRRLLDTGSWAPAPRRLPGGQEAGPPAPGPFGVGQQALLQPGHGHWQQQAQHQVHINQEKQPDIKREAHAQMKPEQNAHHQPPSGHIHRQKQRKRQQQFSIVHSENQEAQQGGYSRRPMGSTTAAVAMRNKASARKSSTNGRRSTPQKLMGPGAGWASVSSGAGGTTWLISAEGLRAHGRPLLNEQLRDLTLGPSCPFSTAATRHLSTARHD